MKILPLPEWEFLDRLLKYDEILGLLYFKERSITDCATLQSMNRFNSMFAGQEAFTRCNKAGYKITSLYKQQYLYHRLIWKLWYKEDPKEIDHIDGNRANNVITNLRSVSRAENCQNKAKTIKTESGCLGVYRAGYRWSAQIKVRGITHNLGVHETLELAVRARKEAEEKFGFHENHGRAK